jgi:ABC-type transport system involved in multi-copper enzyme maturation permease subunit
MMSLWMRQIRGVLRLELRKNLLSRRAIPAHLLAAAPVGLCAMIAIVSMFVGPPEPAKDPAGLAIFYAGMYQAFIVRVVIFFGCAWIFMNLFRGEVIDRSLHYYFLTPIRREVLVAGKFVSGWLSATILFVACGLAAQVVLYLSPGLPGGPGDLLTGNGIATILRYAGVTALGCLGYGAIFLLIGLFLRNPIIPAIAIWGWEWINFLLPALLKKISVIYYLESLCPLPPMTSAIEIPADPAPAWLSVPGLILVTAIILALSGLRIRRMEIDYGGD